MALFLLGMELVCAILFFFICMMASRKRKNMIRILNQVTTQKSSGLTSWMNRDKIEVYLAKNGISYVYAWFSPYIYYLFKFGLTIFFGMAGLAIYPLLGIPLGVIGFISLDLLIRLANKGENEKMLSDIGKVYHLLKMQAKAGSFITDSLIECFLNVNNKRLKDALMEFTSKIIINSNMEEALEEFQLQFNNPQIDAFCTVIEQFMENGKSIHTLDDLTDQIDDFQETLTKALKEKIARRIQLNQILIFVGAAAFCAYPMLYMIYDALKTL